MNATRTGFTLGVRRTRGIALALVLLALLAGGAAGYFIRAATSSPALVVPHAVVVAPRALSGDPVGDRWWEDAAVAPSSVSSNPAGDRWWQDAPAASGAVISRDAWWKDMP